MPNPTQPDFLVFVVAKRSRTALTISALIPGPLSATSSIKQSRSGCSSMLIFTVRAPADTAFMAMSSTWSMSSSTTVPSRYGRATSNSAVVAQDLADLLGVHAPEDVVANHHGRRQAARADASCVGQREQPIGGGLFEVHAEVFDQPGN